MTTRFQPQTYQEPCYVICWKKLLNMSDRTVCAPLI